MFATPLLRDASAACLQAGNFLPNLHLHPLTFAKSLPLHRCDEYVALSYQLPHPWLLHPWLPHPWLPHIWLPRPSRNCPPSPCPPCAQHTFVSSYTQHTAWRCPMRNPHLFIRLLPPSILYGGKLNPLMLPHYSGHVVSLVTNPLATTSLDIAPESATLIIICRFKNMSE